jgi:hypothetical protein
MWGVGDETIVPIFIPGPAGPGSTGTMIRMQKKDGVWYKENPTVKDQFDVPANYNEKAAAEKAARADVASGAGVGIPGKPVTFEQKLTFGWAESAAKVAQVKEVIKKIQQTIQVGGAGYFTIDNLMRAKGMVAGQEWGGAKLEQDTTAFMALLGPAAGYFGGYLGSIGITGILYAYLYVYGEPLTDQEKANIEATVELNLDVPLEEAKQNVEARYWNYYEEIYKKLAKPNIFKQGKGKKFRKLQPGAAPSAGEGTPSSGAGTPSSGAAPAPAPATTPSDTSLSGRYR